MLCALLLASRILPLYISNSILAFYAPPSLYTFNTVNSYFLIVVIFFFVFFFSFLNATIRLNSQYYNISAKYLFTFILFKISLFCKFAILAFVIIIIFILIYLLTPLYFPLVLLKFFVCIVCMYKEQGLYFMYFTSIICMYVWCLYDLNANTIYI